MKRLLLSLWLVGAAVYTGDTLMMLRQIAAPDKLPIEVRATPRIELRYNIMANAVSPDRVAVRSPAVAPEDAEPVRPSPDTSQIAKISTPLPGKEAIWVEVSRAARVHSAPTVRLYPLGSDLHLIDYQPGGFQVLDPTTLERGSIYGKYLEAIRRPNQRQAASQAIQSATREELQKPTLRQPSARAKKQQPNQAKKKQSNQTKKKQPNNVERAQPRIRAETVASLVEKAFRGY